jgi:hypothetical protein
MRVKLTFYFSFFGSHFSVFTPQFSLFQPTSQFSVFTFSNFAFQTGFEMKELVFVEFEKKYQAFAAVAV